MSISKVNVSGADHQIVGSPRYATCSTAAATAAKVATIADGSSTFSLEKGARICVSFTYANTASAATLNVASTGAKAICWQGSALVSSQYWQAGAVVDFVYDGNGWSIVGIAKDNNSTNFLPLSGGSLTGNLTVGSSSIGTNGYIEGTWLKTTKATEKAGDFATIDGDGWVYKRAPANVLGDIGGQAKITANGFLKGDGTGVITADKPVFWVTLKQNSSTQTYYADKTFSQILAAYDSGYEVKAIHGDSLFSFAEFNRLSNMYYFIHVSNNTVYTFLGRKSSGVEEWTYSTNGLVPKSRTINNKSLSSNITLAPSDIGAQSKITANGILKGDGAGTITAADETEVELVDLPQEVFWATYGTTTFSNVKEAYDANKIVKVNYNNEIYSLSVMTTIAAVFSCINGSQGSYKQLSLWKEDNNWQYSNVGDIIDIKRTITLSAASWTGSDPYNQIVSIFGSTANTKVDIQPSETLYDQLVADNVGYLAIKNVDGTLTAVAKGGKPSVDLTVQVTYNNVY